MALTETWIKPEDTANPAALSNNLSFFYTPRLTGRGGGTGLLSLLPTLLKSILLLFIDPQDHNVTSWIN